MTTNTPLAWLDLEMTGLDPRTDRILEIAVIVTDSGLNIVAEAPVIAIHQSDEVLNRMGPWCTTTHAATGLTERVRKSTLSERDAERAMLSFLQKHLKPGESPMCGNTIGQDRAFLFHYMPQLHDYFHYRNIDVSTLKELAGRWNPGALEGLQKESPHKALEDIRESVREMRHYREHFLKT